MSGFDAYYKWLGIPPEDQPPDHYRLLGLKQFESDPEVIEAAADQRMAFLQRCATGEHGAESQKLLNEVAAARVCLLRPENKATYDQDLCVQSEVAHSNFELGTDETWNGLPVDGPRIEFATPLPRGDVVQPRKAGNGIARIPPEVRLSLLFGGIAIVLIVGVVIWSVRRPSDSDGFHGRTVNRKTGNSALSESSGKKQATATAPPTTGTPIAGERNGSEKSPDREVALWVLEISRGRRAPIPKAYDPGVARECESPPVLAIEVEGDEREVLSVNELPKEGFHVTQLNLNGLRGVSDESLTRLRGLTHLRRLSLMFQPVSDSGLIHISGMPKLTALFLNGTSKSPTEVTDSVIGHLSKLPDLKQLRLSGTKISDNGIQELVRLKSLERLWLDGTRVTERGIVRLKELPKLRQLDLTGIAIGARGVEQLSTMPTLRWLSLGGFETDLTVGDLSALGRSRLERLAFRLPKFANELKFLERMKTLRSLDVEAAQGHPAQILSYLPDLTELEVLRLSVPIKVNASTVFLRNLTKLRRLDLRLAPSFDDSAIENLRRMVFLEKLDLSGTKVTDEGVRVVSGLRQLEWLSLAGTGVTNDGLANLKDLSRLKYLRLSDTRVDDAGIDHLKSLSGLRSLDVSESGVTRAGGAMLNAALPQCTIIGALATPAVTKPAIPRLLLTLKGHDKWVSSVAYNTEGNRIASTGTFDNSVRLWDAVSGTLLQTLRGHLGGVRDVAFSPDGKWVASASGDDTVKVWNTATGRTMRSFRRSFRHKADVTCLAVSKNGALIASGSDDRTVIVWHAKTGRKLATLRGHTDIVHSVDFRPDGNQVASASWDDTIRIWNSSGQLVSILRGHTGNVHDVKFSPDGSRLVSGSADGTVRLWDARTAQSLVTLRGHSAGVTSVEFSPDGKLIASGSGDDTVKIWNAETGKEQWTLRGHTNDVHGVAFRADGRHLASAGLDGVIKIWSLPPASKTAKSQSFSKQELKRGKGKAGSQERRFQAPSKSKRPITRSKGSRIRWTQVSATERSAIEFLLRRGAEIFADADGKPEEIKLFPEELNDQDLTKIAILKSLRKVSIGHWYRNDIYKQQRKMVYRPTRVTHAGIKHLAKLSKLEELYIGNIDVDDNRLREISNLSSLKRLSFCPKHVVQRNVSTFTDQGLQDLVSLKNLEALSLGGCRGFSNRGLSSIAKISTLKSLNLSWTRITDAGVKELEPLTMLEELILYQCGITDAGLASVAHFSRLKELDVGSTSVTDAGFRYLTALPKLEVLWFSSTKISDRGLAHLEQLRKLKSLNMFGTQVTDAGISSLKKLQNLEDVNLLSSRITSAGVNELKKHFPNARIRP